MDIPKPVVHECYKPIYIATGIFGVLFFLGLVVPRPGHANTGLIRSSVMLTSLCMWIFWFTVYVAQMNPIVGPKVENRTLAWLAVAWGVAAKNDSGATALAAEPAAAPPPDDEPA